MSMTPRARAREQTMLRIVEVGREQLDKGGPEALNLRAIARDLGIVSSGIYRYVPDRAHLLTMLIVDAFEALDDAVARGIGEATETRDRFLRLVFAMRAWALKFPQRWALIYGTPIIGYEAPASETTVAGTKVSRRLAELLTEASVEQLEPRSSQFSRDLAAAAVELDVELSADVMEKALEAWISIIGVINAEVFGYLGKDTLHDHHELNARMVSRLADELGI